MAFEILIEKIWDGIKESLFLTSNPAIMIFF